MKKAYSAPKLTIHGKVQDLTQVLGPSSGRDVLSIGGNIINDTTGSRNFSK